MEQTTANLNNQQKNKVFEVLQETELGEFLLKYKTAVLAFVSLLMLSLIGYGGYVYWHGEKINQWSGQIFQFRTGSFKDYMDKKIDDGELKKQFELMATSMKGERILFLPLIETSDELAKRGNKKEALGLLQNWGIGGVKLEPTAEYLIGVRIATLLEDLDKNDEAIAQLEKLRSSSLKIMETKTVLDLGRLYLKKADKEKALKQFQFVIDNTAQADLVKLARLYKGQISKK